MRSMSCEFGQGFCAQFPKSLNSQHNLGEGFSESEL